MNNALGSRMSNILNITGRKTRSSLGGEVRELTMSKIMGFCRPLAVTLTCIVSGIVDFEQQSQMI